MADAPHFRAYWSRIEGTRVLTMPRTDWDRLCPHFGKPVTLDVAETPMAGISLVSSVVTCIAHQVTSATAQVSIVRYDQADAPKVYNQDRYEVWTDLRSHPRLPTMVNAASTEDNTNFAAFCQENVFLIKRPVASDEHHFATLPASVTVLMQRQP